MYEKTLQLMYGKCFTVTNRDYSYGQCWPSEQLRFIPTSILRIIEVWACCPKNITQEPASLFLHESLAVLVRCEMSSDLPQQAEFILLTNCLMPPAKDYLTAMGFTSSLFTVAFILRRAFSPTTAHTIHIQWT